MNFIIQFAKDHGLQKDARVIRSTITKLQFQRLVKEIGIPEESTFQSEEEAIRWLQEGD